MITPGQIKALIAALLALAVIAGGYFAVRSYNNAIEKNATLQKDFDAVLSANIEFSKRITELEASRKVDAAAIEAKESERKAYAELLALTVKDYRNDLKKLQEADRACAMRTVPAPVDRMLSQNRR